MKARSIFLIIFFLCTNFVFPTQISGKIANFILICGQSNATGKASKSGIIKNNFTSLDTVKLAQAGESSLNLSQGQILTLGEYLNTTSTTHGFEFALGEGLHKSGMSDIIIVKYAMGGSWIDLWGKYNTTVTGGISNLYTNAINFLEDKVSEIKQLGYSEVSFQGLVWLQGESDAVYTSRANVYDSKLNTLMSNFRTDIAGIFNISSSSVSVVLIQPATYVDKTKYQSQDDEAKIINALISYAAIDSCCDFIPTNDLTGYVDAIHFNTSSQNIIGTRVADKIKDDSVSVIYGGNEAVTDIDGNVYTTVTIGTQIWLVENLRTTKYRNGDEIGTTSTPDFDISAETTPKYQWVYRGNEANLANYGRLYTWYAATDPRQITPVGYRLPTDQDLIDLANYLIANGNHYSSDGLQNTGTADAGNKIPKALASTTLWQSTTTAGSPGNVVASNNASGFNLVPGGRRMPAIYMWDYGNRGAYIWSSTEHLTDATKAIPRWMFYNSTAFTTRPAGELKSAGMSIRCIKGDAPAGIKNIESNALKFQFYPSQVKDILTISFANAMTENVKLTILSTDGKLVYQNVYSSNGVLDKISVQLSHLKQGLYLCRVNSKNVSSVVIFTKK